MMRDEVIHSPCQAEKVRDVTLSCDFKPDLVRVIDQRRRDGSAGAAVVEGLLHKGEAAERFLAPNVVTVELILPDD
jgi:hypothetical protein